MAVLLLAGWCKAAKIEEDDADDASPTRSRRSGRSITPGCGLLSPQRQCSTRSTRSARTDAAARWCADAAQRWRTSRWPIRSCAAGHAGLLKMNRAVATCPTNQWPAENFYNQVSFNEAQEIRVLAAYDKPIDRPAIRTQVMQAMLAYAIPAGNA